MVPPPPPAAAAAATPPHLSARPCPPNPREQQRVLHSIYQAIDTHNYAKVLKLTSSSSSSSSSSSPSTSTSSDRWDIVRALRIHALERCGKVREALILLWEVVAGDVVVAAVGAAATADVSNYSQQQRLIWSELYQRIQALTSVEDVIQHEGHGSSSNNRSGVVGSSHHNHHRSLGDIQLLDAVRRLDARSFAPIVNPYTSSISNDINTNESATTTTATTNKSSSGKISKGGSASGKSTTATTAKKSSSYSSTDYSINYYYPPVTDETVLQTLSVTLRNCELYDTMSEMYHQATTALSSSSSSASLARKNEEVEEEEEENYRNVLEEGVCVHFKAVCDCTSLDIDTNGSGGCNNRRSNTDEGNGKEPINDDWSRITMLQSQLPRLQSVLNMTKYYERMQTTSLQLAKVTAQPLHFQWTAISSLWYKESLERLVSTVEYIQSLIASYSENGDNAMCAGGDQGGDNDRHAMLSLLIRQVLEMLGLVDSSDIASRVATFRQKMALLPRLAESLSSRMVHSSQQTLSSSGGGGGGGGGALNSSAAVVVVSENDWDIYLEALLVQGKKLEALEVLKNIQCTPMLGDGVGLHPTNDDGVGAPRHEIDDEDTIKNHVGSMLRYTRRKKLERLAQWSHELDMFEDAEGYYRELLIAFPDQWTYWMGLVESACVRVKSSSSLSSVPPGLDTTKKQIVSIDRVGWQRCHSFATEIVSMEENVEKHTLRGPHLILLELAALELRQVSIERTTTDDINDRVRMVALLRDEICQYGSRFGSQASCCFADVRPYVRLLVQASSSEEEITDSGTIPDEVLHLLKWAHDIWEKNTQSTDTNHTDGEASMEDGFRERRKKLRNFIFAVQVVYGVASEMKNLSLHLLQTYAPTISQMVSEWRNSLVCLPSVAAKDGGQKEVLPGDEIILLISQQLLFQASSRISTLNDSSTTLLLQSAALLEESMDHSPYNPHLKIAAISVYSKLNSAGRALNIFQDMGVKQIQLDSCTYIILPLLIRGGLFTSAIKLSASILRLHGSTSKDVKTYSSKSLQNGLVFKAKEMATFQCEKMRPSLQLLYSKGVLLNTAPLMISSDLEDDTMVGTKPKGKSPSAVLAAEKGFCGNEEDLVRAEQLAIDAEIHFNAPSIIHASAQSIALDNFPGSDNRDMSVNYFEILCHTSHLTHMEMVAESLRIGHIHGLLARAIMVVEVANGPKKGKLPKPSEESSYRCQSLRYAATRASEFVKDAKLDEVDKALWNSCCQLCEVIIVVINGSPGDDSTGTTLAERDALAASTIQSTTELIKSARRALTAYDTTENRSSIGGRVCRLLPDYICPLFILLETTSRLFSLFGWGKRKRLTKAASGALALAAASLQDLISDMLNIMNQFRSVRNDIESLVGSAASPEFGQDALQRVVREVASSRELTKDRVDPFLVQMRERLQTFHEEL